MVVAVKMAVAGTLGIVVVKILTPHGLRKPHLTTKSGKIVRKEVKDFQKKPSKNKENICYKCGMKRHWSRACLMPKYLADLYHASLKEK